MNKNFTPPSKEPTGTVEKTLSIEPDRHFEVALQSGNCLDFNDECIFSKSSKSEKRNHISNYTNKQY